MSSQNKQNKADRLYTSHGQKMAHGIPSVINGHKALAAFQGDKIVGYTTLDEINRAFYAKEDNLPEYHLDY